MDNKTFTIYNLVSAWWAPQSEEGPDGADQLVPLYPSEKLPPMLSDQAMCFSQNSRTAYTTYYSRKVRKVDDPNSSVSLETTREGLKVFKNGDFHFKT